MNNENSSNGGKMSMRQGSPGGRRPRGRHNNNGGDRGNNGPSGPRGGGDRNRSPSSLRHQSFDSNGPDVRVRGNAWQVYEKYQSLARDAQSAGDRVLAENYLQYAEHYYRVTEAINEATATEQRQRAPAPQPFAGQPEVPTNYYTPDGQLIGSPVPADQQPQPTAQPQPQPKAQAQPQPAQPRPQAQQPRPRPSKPTVEAQAKEPAAQEAQVTRRAPPPKPVDPFLATDDDGEDSDSGPQKLVAGR